VVLNGPLPFNSNSSIIQKQQSAISQTV